MVPECINACNYIVLGAIISKFGKKMFSKTVKESLYIYHFSTVVDFSSEKYNGVRVPSLASSVKRTFDFFQVRLLFLELEMSKMA